MAKRFTDSDKWTKKPWFRTLKPAHKLFWVYLLDACNQAGIWEVDFSLASLLIGDSLNESEIMEALKKQYVEIKNGRKWFIPDFIDFQYGELKETNRMHAFILGLLKKEGVSTPLKQVSEGAKDKDKVLELELDKEGVLGETKLDPEFNQLEAFNEFWENYPARGRLNKSASMRIFC